jgi:hypothetical protein
MPNAFVAAGLTQLSSAFIAMLADGGVLVNCVWRDPFESNLQVGKGESVTVREPLVVPASNFTGTAVVSDLVEGKYVVTVDQQPYNQTKITTKERNLQVSDVAVQILQPQAAGVAEYVDQAIANFLSTTGGAVAAPIAGGWTGAIAAAREQMTMNGIPNEGRFFIVGPGVITDLISSSIVTTGNYGGASAALSEATLGRLYGFTIVESPLIPADTAYAIHRTAVGAIFRTPVAPSGAESGSASWNGFAAQAVYGYDNSQLSDILTVHTLFGLGASTVSFDKRALTVTLV